MKKYNNFLADVTYEKVYAAYLQSRKGKRYRNDVILFDMKREYYIQDMVNQLKNGTYIFNDYREFYVYEPKKRRVLAACFKDRIVHTFVVQNIINKVFVPRFITNSYACLKDKGMHKCVLQVKKDMYNISKVNPNAYIIKMDVAKFFASINRELLFEIMEQYITDKMALKLIKDILDSSKKYDEVQGVSIPIGNFTSQMFGNIYLHQVDIYATKILKCKYYYRYMDDTCIIVENKLEAIYILEKLIEFYDKVLELKLNNKTQIFKLKQGLNFCGYKIKIGRMFLRNRGKKKLLNKLKYIRRSIEENKMSITEAKLKLAGHVGYMKIANINKLVKKHFYV